MDVIAPDGVSLSVQEVGNPAGPEILLIHGIMQSGRSWIRQTQDAALARDFRMVTMDLRGHGASGKPEGDDHYRDGKRWADDVAAVIAATGMRRPVLVGWSYGGRVISDYVAHYGSKNIAGVNFVGAVTKSDPALMGPGRVHLRDALSTDLAVCVPGTIAFQRACFAIQPDSGSFEEMLAVAMMMPHHARRGATTRPHYDGSALAAIACPVLVTHGSEDALILPAMAQATMDAIPHAELSLYDGIGHATFFEDAPRFNRELAAFVSQCVQPSSKATGGGDKS